MANVIIKIRYHLKNFLFQKFALPVVINENISKAVFRKYLPKSAVIIDCGAHNGKDSVELANRYKKGIIHAFEPVDKVFSQLKSNSSKYDNIICHPTALSNQTGQQSFFVSEGNSDGSSSLLEPKDVLLDHPGNTFSNKVIVNTITLDEWAERNNIKKVDLLWLDMQGFELYMLKASTKILPTVKVIHTEVSTKETYKNVPIYREYRQFLEAEGFTMLVEAIPKGWDMGNVLFIRK